MKNRPIAVLCVDDNHLVGEALEIKFQNDNGFQWLGQVFDADAMLREMDRRRPDVILLDIDMPGRDPFEALEQVGREHPDVKVIMLTGHVSGRFIDRAFEAGAWGYLSKSDGTDAIAHAISRVIEGEVVLGSDIESSMG